MNDVQLMDLLKQDPSEGMMHILSAYGGLVQTIVTRILVTGTRQDIEECVSDIFVSLWEHRDKLSERKGSVKSYLSVIARNTSINYLRKNKPSLDLLPLKENLLGFALNLEDEICRQDSQEILHQALLEMNKLDLEIFIRRYFYYEKIKEISGALDLDPKTIENRLYRGRQTLKEKLKNRGVSNEETG